MIDKRIPFLYDEAMKRMSLWMLALVLLVTGCVTEIPATETATQTQTESRAETSEQKADTTESVDATQSPQQVADYLRKHGELPDYYLTKNEARDLGWVSEEGNLWEVTEGGVIGGDRFGNREGLLPDAAGRTWYEADVNYQGGFRGAERLVFSNDGLIFYTDDHYDSFSDWTEESP